LDTPINFVLSGQPRRSLAAKGRSSSFLKKRTKKLLSFAGGTTLAHLNEPLDAISKWCLLLF